VDGDVILGVVPGITPALDEVEGLVGSLLDKGDIRRVFVDLTDVDSLSCALVARLVVLNKRLEAAGRKLTLCGLRPIVREEFDCLGLEQAFEISSQGGNALSDP
jgi:anti-anti-sigma factor